MSPPTIQIKSPQSAKFEEICEEIDTLLLSRYPPTTVDDSSSSSSPSTLSDQSVSFRDYTSSVTPTRVIHFYKEQHEKQTLSSVTEKRNKFSLLNRAKMSIWDG